MDRTEGTTHHNAIAADGIVGSETVFINITSSNITGSTLDLPWDGTLGGMTEVITGTTAAASANFSMNHTLGSTPSWVGLTAHGTNGSNTINLVAKGTGQIIVESALGTVALEAFLVR